MERTKPPRHVDSCKKRCRDSPYSTVLRGSILEETSWNDLPVCGCLRHVASIEDSMFVFASIRHSHHTSAAILKLVSLSSIRLRPQSNAIPANSQRVGENYSWSELMPDQAGVLETKPSPAKCWAPPKPPLRCPPAKPSERRAARFDGSVRSPWIPSHRSTLLGTSWAGGGLICMT